MLGGDGIKQFITLGQCHVAGSLIKYSRLISNAVLARKLLFKALKVTKKIQSQLSCFVV